VHATNARSLAAFRAVGFADLDTVVHFLMHRPRLRVNAHPRPAALSADGAA
jgi:hypothetical protein